MTDPSVHVLVCDDETDLSEMVAEFLGRRGYRVTTCADAAAMHEAVEKEEPDVIVLDINMPGEDGLSALRTLRAGREVPVLMMTAASEVIDRIVGLELGADDYLGKPVDLRELEARLKAVLRRRRTTESKRAETGENIEFGPCRLDMSGARLFGPEGDEIPVTAMEFSLLRVFAENRGRVLNRDQLLEQAHDRSWDPLDRSIDIRISRLRRKIEPNPQKPEVIRTVRGIGYVFGGRD